MDREKILKAIKRKRLEETMQGCFLTTLNERISRYQELDFIKLTPNTHFAFVSVECINLYRDGYFLACIALCQVIAEAIVRSMCERSNFNSISQDYEVNIENIHKRKIRPDHNDPFKETWRDRNNHHHLNPTIPTEKSKLRDIAKSKIIVFHKIEAKVFEFNIINGVILPMYPKYWDFNENGMLNVYLRIET
jgi:hypothetical protein